MIKIAVLDDYQNAFQQIVEVDKYKDKFNFQVFNEPFSDEKEAAVQLEDFEALFIMRERTPITKALIIGLPKLKYICVFKCFQLRNCQMVHKLPNIVLFCLVLRHLVSH